VPEAASNEQDPRAEGQGDTLGEAKWNAVKSLEPRFPGVGPDSVRFEVLEESEGAVRVAAEVDLEAWRATAQAMPDEPGERVRSIVARVALALELGATVDIEEDDEEIRATVSGPDLGLLIGRHGSTIDALQDLVGRAAFRGDEDRKRVVVDAAGYRERREAALRRAADRAAADALAYHRPVELDPMGPHERRTVHVYLRDRHDVETHSEGDEPERRLVVTPVEGESPGA
jgi:spoIIIJ-associated protein